MPVKVSIIVPVYNAELYLKECIDSILQQTFADLEIILVDDGSTDGSGGICDFYQLRDKRISVIHKKNGGLTEANRYGMSKVTGDWIFFVDADDSLTVDAIECLLKQSNDDCNIIVGFSFQGGGEICTMDAEEWRNTMIHGDPIMCTRWGKLYRRSVIDEDVFNDAYGVVVGEDMLMNIAVAFRNNSPVKIVQTKIYNYRRPDTSMTAVFRFNVQKYHTLYVALHKVIDCYDTEYVYLGTLVQNGIEMVLALCREMRPFDGRISDSDLICQIKNDLKIVNNKVPFNVELLLCYPDCLFIRIAVKCQRRCVIISQHIKRLLQ